MKKNEFKREKIATTNKAALDAITDIAMRIGVCNEDFLSDTLTAELSGYIYSNMADERELIYYCPPPRFLDWLFRRHRQAIFNLKVKDLLLHPPKVDDTVRIYVVASKE